MKQPEKTRNTNPLSLYPLSLEEALKKALNTSNKKLSAPPSKQPKIINKRK
jgi:hypothetical protein